MGKRKNKIMKLTDEQYVKYIMSLKDEAALYKSDGDMYVPDSLSQFKTDETDD